MPCVTSGHARVGDRTAKQGSDTSRLGHSSMIFEFFISRHFQTQLRTTQNTRIPLPHCIHCSHSHQTLQIAATRMPDQRMVRHGLPPVDQFLLSAITGRYVCCRDGSPSSIFGLDRLVLFHSRRQAPKPACDGAVLPRHHASQKSCVAFAR